jgi:biotin carboxylase
VRVAIIAGTPQLLQAAQKLGIEAVLVEDPARLDSLHAEAPFDRILSLTEKGLRPSAEATDRFGLAGNGLRVVRLLQDKTAMRALLNSKGLSRVAVHTPGEAADLADFCRRIGGPVILKPSDGSGSLGVFRVDEPRDARAAWDGFVRAAPASTPIAEEYLDGPEVSVEAFSHHGMHTVIAVTDKLTQGHFVEVGHTMPSTLPDATRSAVVALVREFLAVIGLIDGPSHTEVKLTTGGPRIIESHNRIGGDKIRELVRLAYGIDLVALTVGAPFGLLEPPRRDPEPVGGAAIRFLTPEPGVVEAITLPAELPHDAKISLDVQVGDEVVPVRRSQDRAGYVLAGGADAADAALRCAQLLAGVSIETG